MEKVKLPDIEFEGKKVKPSRMGFYRCPFNCHTTGYPAPKWKTEKGFRQHMEKCTGKPSHKNKIDQKTLDNIEASKKLIDAFLVDHPIGSKLIISTYRITKPTHEQRFNRMVKVRYEEERRYFATEITINSLIPNSGYNPSFLINNTYWKGDIKIFDSLKEAEKHASEGQISYNKHCNEAASFR
jgi:hypothetical protein